MKPPAYKGKGLDEITKNVGVIKERKNPRSEPWGPPTRGHQGEVDNQTPKTRVGRKNQRARTGWNQVTKTESDPRVGRMSQNTRAGWNKIQEEPLNSLTTYRADRSRNTIKESCIWALITETIDNFVQDSSVEF